MANNTQDPSDRIPTIDLSEYSKSSFPTTTVGQVLQQARLQAAQPQPDRLSEIGLRDVRFGSHSGGKESR